MLSVQPLCRHKRSNSQGVSPPTRLLSVYHSTTRRNVASFSACPESGIPLTLPDLNHHQADVRSLWAISTRPPFCGILGYCNVKKISLGSSRLHLPPATTMTADGEFIGKSFCTLCERIIGPWSFADACCGVPPTHVYLLVCRTAATQSARPTIPFLATTGSVQVAVTLYM